MLCMQIWTIQQTSSCMHVSTQGHRCALYLKGISLHLLCWLNT